VRVVAQHAHQAGIRATVEALDGVELAADKKRLQHHMIPGVLVELLRGIGIAMGHRLEDGLHGAACAFSGSRNVQLGVWVEGQTAIESDELADVGSAKELLQPRLEPRTVCIVGGQDEGQARRLIDAPIAWVPARTGSSSIEQILGR